MYWLPMTKVPKHICLSSSAHAYHCFLLLHGKTRCCRPIRVRHLHGIAGIHSL